MTGATDDEACVHHFRIAEPNGPVAEGMCKKCGERRNYVTGDPLDYRELPLGLAGLGHPYYYKTRGLGRK